MSQVVVVSGGGALPSRVVTEVDSDATVIAADSGLDHAVAAGLKPTVLREIGLEPPPLKPGPPPRISRMSKKPWESWARAISTPASNAAAATRNAKTRFIFVLLKSDLAARQATIAAASQATRP